MLRQLCCHFYLSKISRRRRATSLERALTGSRSRSWSRSPESDAKCQLQKLHTHACYCQVTGTDTDSYSHNDSGGQSGLRGEWGAGGGTAASCYDCAVPSPPKKKKKNYKIFNFNISGGWRRQLPSKLLLLLLHRHPLCLTPAPPAVQIGGNTSATPTQQLNVCLGARCACPWLAK